MDRRRRGFAAAVIGVALLAACAQPAPPTPEPAAPPVEQRPQVQAPDPVDELLAELSLEEKVGQVFMVVAYGTDASSADPAQAEANRELLGAATAAEAVARWHLGGVMYLDRNPLDQGRARQSTGNLSDPAQIARLSQGLQAAAGRDSGIGLLIAVDQEGGRVARVGPPVTQFPAAARFGRIGDPALAEASGEVTASELRALGINHVLAPVADVIAAGATEAIGDRSYSSDPAQAAALVGAHVRGLQSAGAAATGKHFPGHGDTAVDSHQGLPVIAHDRATWERTDRPPFDAAIAAGVAVVMTGHLAVPSLDPSDTPATLSPAIIDAVLRRQLGFDGVVMTDSLWMGALRGRASDGELAVAAFEAGNDLLLMPPSLPEGYTALLDAVRSGRVSQQRLDASVRRLLALKLRLGLVPAPDLDVGAAAAALGTPAHRAVRERVAAACRC